MINLSAFNGKKIKVTFEDGSIIEANGAEYMLGDDFDEEYNSLALEVTKVIKDRESYPFREYLNSNVLTAIYENENISVEEL